MITLLTFAPMFGETPTAADASVAAMLSNMRATPGKTLLKTRVAEDEILCRYIDRMQATMQRVQGNDRAACTPTTS